MPRQFDYRMLIVDDDAVFCEIADELFSSLGYTVRCADDGFEALAIMKQALPDIIICDLNLPKMSGFELLSHYPAEVPANSGYRHERRICGNGLARRRHS